MNRILFLLLTSFLATACATQYVPITPLPAPLTVQQRPSIAAATPSDTTPASATTYAYTYPSPDGNHYLPGTAELPNTTPLTVDLPGTPHWVVGGMLADEAVFVVALADGALVAVHVRDGGAALESLDITLAPGEPPALALHANGYEVLNTRTDNNAVSHPVALPGGTLAFLDANNDLQLLSPSASHTISGGLLPDARLIQSPDGDLLLLSRPTSDYDHGIAGDDLEAGGVLSVQLTSSGPQTQEFFVPPGQVIEGVYPIAADLDQDGSQEIIVTLSGPINGARLALYSPDGDLLASSMAIGLGYRWRHQIAVAPFGPNGEWELVDVRTPHIGGAVEFFTWQGEELLLTATLPGFGSHVIYTRNMDMAVAADLDADGRIELLLPTQERTALAAVSRTADGAAVDWQLMLNAPLSTNLALVPLADEQLGLAAGTHAGQLLIWLP